MARRRGAWRKLFRLGSALSVVSGTLALLPGAALADPCGIDAVSSTDPGTALFDPAGYEWDTQGLGTTPPTEYTLRNSVSFDDGGSNGPAGIPPGPRETNDSYDEWPGLYIGSTSDDAPLATSYNSTDNNSCTREDGGRELVFPKLTIGGLEVQYKIFVPSSGIPFARMLTLVTNPGGAPATTSVQLGGINNNDGDLGSDANTGVRSSSSGDAIFTPADLWAVTSDHFGGSTNSDLALAHVLDGPGALDRVDAVTSLVPPDFDDLMFRWQGITILSGQTAAYISFESQQGAAFPDAATEDAAAAAAAQAIENAVPKVSPKAATSATSALYSGMSAREIGSLRNWPSGLTCFGRPPTIVGDDPTNDKLVGTAGADVIYGFGGNDKINGLGGKDRICGIGGKDTLKGGAGKDKLDGGSGKDKLLGGKGKDTCVGGKGKDKAGGCEKEKKIP